MLVIISTLYIFFLMAHKNLPLHVSNILGAKDVPHYFMHSVLTMTMSVLSWLCVCHPPTRVFCNNTINYRLVFTKHPHLIVLGYGTKLIIHSYLHDFLFYRHLQYLRCATRFFFLYIFIFSISHLLLLLLINVSCTVLYNLIGSHSLSKPRNDNNAGAKK